MSKISWSFYLYSTSKKKILYGLELVQMPCDSSPSTLLGSQAREWPPHMPAQAGPLTPAGNATSEGWATQGPWNLTSLSNRWPRGSSLPRGEGQFPFSHAGKLISTGRKGRLWWQRGREWSKGKWSKVKRLNSTVWVLGAWEDLGKGEANVWQRKTTLLGSSGTFKKNLLVAGGC